MMAKKKPASVSVETHKHVADKRRNIPTRETAAFGRMGRSHSSSVATAPSTRSLFGL